MPDAGVVFLEGDVTGVMQGILDVPVVSDCGGGKARRYGRVGDIECDLGCAAPQTCLGVAVQDISGDTNDALDQGLPIGPGHGAGGAEHVDGPGFMPVASSGDLDVSAGGLAGSADGFDALQQRRLIILQLDEELSPGLCGELEGFFWQCMASSVTMQWATRSSLSNCCAAGISLDLSAISIWARTRPAAVSNACSTWAALRSLKLSKLRLSVFPSIAMMRRAGSVARFCRPAAC